MSNPSYNKEKKEGLKKKDKKINSFMFKDSFESDLKVSKVLLII